MVAVENRELLAALMLEGDVFALVDELVARPSWQSDALCKEHPELEFVPSTRTIDPECVSVCRECSVRVPCCAFALGRPSEVGCWGGSSDNQRVRGRLERLSAVELIERVDRPPGAHRFER